MGGVEALGYFPAYSLSTVPRENTRCDRRGGRGAEQGGGGIKGCRRGGSRRTEVWAANRGDADARELTKARCQGAGQQGERLGAGCEGC